MIEVIFKKNIKATKFSTQRVVIQHQDGTRCEFNHAFIEEGIIIKKSGYQLDIIKVYTEHTGDHWFAKGDLIYWRTRDYTYPKTLLQRIRGLSEYWKSQRPWKYYDF